MEDLISDKMNEEKIIMKTVAIPKSLSSTSLSISLSFSFGFLIVLVNCGNQMDDL